MSTETGAGWYFSASHHDPVSGQLHGHTWEVVAWWPAGQDAVALQEALKIALVPYDHAVLPEGLSRAEALAVAIMHFTYHLSSRVLPC